MFYVVKSEENDSPETGTPLHYNGTLYGIFSRYNMKKIIYITPSLSYKKSIQNTTNYLYKCTEILID